MYVYYSYSDRLPHVGKLIPKGGTPMTGTIAIGHQDFERIREDNIFYIDKTRFIREWWERDRKSVV